MIDLNEGKPKPFFQFVLDARSRGAQIRYIEGSPRQKLREQGPRSFYHIMILEACTGENGEKIFLDLFTKEGIAQCFEHLVHDGVLCVHTSHRFVDLPPVLAAIGKELKLHVSRGQDEAPGYSSELAEVGHFTSQWVLLARRENVLNAICKAPANYDELRMKRRPNGVGGTPGEPYWTTPTPLDRVWTDKGPNLLHGVLRGLALIS